MKELQFKKLLYISLIIFSIGLFFLLIGNIFLNISWIADCFILGTIGILFKIIGSFVLIIFSIIFLVYLILKLVNCINTKKDINYFPNNQEMNNFNNQPNNLNNEVNNFNNQPNNLNNESNNLNSKSKN